MGYYINKDSKGNILPAKDKDKALLRDGAKQILWPDEWIPNLVCVVDNGLFDAAGYCHNEAEFEAFTHPKDMRYKQWFTYEHAAELSGYLRDPPNK